jgi:hypothetical protein
MKDTEKQEILNYLRYYSERFLNKKIKDLKEQNNMFTRISTINYDEYTINDFFELCKISELYQNHKISLDEKTKLETLLDKRVLTTIKFKEEMSKESSDDSKTNDLLSDINSINATLRSFLITGLTKSDLISPLDDEEDIEFLKDRKDTFDRFRRKLQK